MFLYLGKKSCFITLYTCSWEQCFITRGKYTEKDSHDPKISQWEQIIYSENRDALGRINYQDNLLQNLLHVHLNDICKTYLIYSTIEEVSDAVKPHLVYIEESHINNKVRNATLNTVLVIPTKVLVKHDFDSVTSYFSSSSCLI